MRWKIFFNIKFWRKIVKCFKLWKTFSEKYFCEERNFFFVRIDFLLKMIHCKNLKFSVKKYQIKSFVKNLKKKNPLSKSNNLNFFFPQSYAISSNTIVRNFPFNFFVLPLKNIGNKYSLAVKFPGSIEI